MWGEAVQPVCLRASFVDSFLRASKPKAKKPSIAWADLAVYPDGLDKVVADRLVTGEIGDPLPSERDWSVPDIAHYIDEQFAPRFGVLVSRLRLGEGTEGPSSVNIFDDTVVGDDDDREAPPEENWPEG